MGDRVQAVADAEPRTDVVPAAAAVKVKDAERSRDRGRIGDARARFAAALDVARETGDASLLARAASFTKLAIR